MLHNGDNVDNELTNNANNWNSETNEMLWKSNAPKHETLG